MDINFLSEVCEKTNVIEKKVINTDIIIDFISIIFGIRVMNLKLLSAQKTYAICILNILNNINEFLKATIHFINIITKKTPQMLKRFFSLNLQSISKPYHKLY